MFVCGSCNIVHNTCKTRHNVKALTHAKNAHMCLHTLSVTVDRYQLLPKPATKTKDTVQKKIIILGAHLTSPLPTFKSCVHLFAASDLPRQRVSPCLSLRFCLTLFVRFCLKENSSSSSEFLCMTVGCRGDSAFALELKTPGCQMHLD